jgi:hypothetical protein
VYFDAQMLDDNEPVNFDAFYQPQDVRDSGSGAVCPTGAIGGSVCAPNGDVLYGASIRAESEDCLGRPVVVEATSDQAGRFRLDGLPASYTEVTIQSGVFVGRYGVDVEAGQVIGLTQSGTTKVCFPTNSAGLAVLQGDYDKVENLIEDLGFEHEVLCGGYGTHGAAQKLLLDPGRLANFDILFVNCINGIELRATNPEVDDMKTNLRDFVRHGGSLYVSDLSSDFITQLWPDVAVFDTSNPSSRELDPCCLCSDCQEECPIETIEMNACGEVNGLPPQCRAPSIPTGRGQTGDLPASVVSEFLRQSTGLESLTVTFNGDNWVEVDSVSEDVEVLVQSGTQPLMFLFQPYPGGGKVAYTSFHIHIQATDPMKKLLRSLIFRL